MKVRYRFGDFCVSPARRTLVRSGEELALIPRYLDLLILLLERRHEAVHRREIFETVWSDVVVSDGALSQAVRTLRRTLGDDSREPLYIRTVSRHGYRFAFESVVEEPEDESPLASPRPPAPPPPPAAGDPFERALEKLLGDDDPDERRGGAEALHVLGTAEALRRLGRRPGHETARALLRDARWDVPGAGPVPLLGQPGGLAAARILTTMRFRRALRLAEKRWAAASAGGAAAGAVAGALGGLALRLAPGSHAPASAAVTLALVGAIVGGLGAAGVGRGWRRRRRSRARCAEPRSSSRARRGAARWARFRTSSAAGPSKVSSAASCPVSAAVWKGSGSAPPPASATRSPPRGRRGAWRPRAVPSACARRP